MSFNISQLKNISASTLSSIVAKENSNGRYVDNRFWTPQRDAAGNARAIIRILPSIREGELPWVEQWSYGLKGPGGWYIETSRRTIGQPDPMAEYIAEQWRAAQTEADKQSLRSRGLSKARHTYIANVYIVNDPEHPENNGTVRLWRFGQKIYEMITDMAKPDPFDETKGGVNVTDWDNGCDLKLIVYTQDKFPRYDKSSFNAPSSIGSDEKIVQIADKMYDLGEFTSSSNVKSYEALRERVETVFGISKPHLETQFDSAPRPVATAPAHSPVFANATPTPTTPAQTAVKPVVDKPAKSAPWEDDEIDFDELMKDIE